MPIEPLRYGIYYHIYNRGNNRENLFVEQRNYPYFLKLYSTHILPVAETFAYCLLPNHFHLAIRTRTEDEQEVFWRERGGDLTGDLSNLQDLSNLGRTPFKLREPSQAFKNLFIAYTRAFNRATDRTGALFERPFHRKVVDKESYFLNLITYIHQNPQRHSLVDDFRDWKWSSTGAYESARPSHIQREQVLHWFGGRREFSVAHDGDLTYLDWTEEEEI